MHEEEGDKPLPMQSADAFLQDFHATHPGATGRAFASGRIDGGRQSSYDLLAAFIAEEAGGEVVMDLACGDGVLASLLLSLDEPPAVVIGIDASAAELKQAKRRLRRRAVLHQGRAQAIPTPAGEVAAVGCHMAMTLLEPIEPVLDHVARILLPGDAFGAIVCGPLGSGPLMDAFQALIAQEQPKPPVLGDPRATSAAGLQTLLEERFSRVEISEHTLTVTAPLELLWAQVLLTRYDVFSLPVDRQDAVRSALEAQLGTGPVSFMTTIRFARAWRGWS